MQRPQNHRFLTSPGSFLFAAIVLLAGLANSATAQNVDINLRVELGRASNIIIPQARGGGSFTLEQRGQAIVIDSVQVRAGILEQTATTTMEIALRNPGSQQIEAVLLLPVPDGAVVSSFMFEGAASEPTAQLLRRDEARRLYDSIVAKVRDPALLEFAGYNLIRSSVFPVAAGGTQKVRLTYENILAADGDRVDFVIPRSESLDRRAPWSISLDIQSKHPISTVYSPSHEIDTMRDSARRMRVKLADRASMEPGAFRLSYLLERGGNGVSASLLAYPDHTIGPFNDGGYFLLMAGLPADVSDIAQTIKREVTIVIDRSGSMAGEKMDQAKAAALQIVEGLDDGEAFNIIDYSTSVSAFSARGVIKDDRTALEARRYIAAIRPGGGTNIHDALSEALRSPPHENFLPIVLFLTDGLPTVGQTSEVSIRELVEKANDHDRRVFTFGVGHDVNVPLLDRVADVSRATATYVLPKEDVELKVAQVFKRLYGPVLADVTVQTIEDDGSVNTRLVRDVMPSKIPDLFEGDQLILLGQYQQERPIKFRLTGNYLGNKRSFEFEFDLDSASTHNAFVPRLWASRRIAYLVDQIRQAGAPGSGIPSLANISVFDDPRFRELADEILRLSMEFGILTEYTAFLATEGTNLNDWETLRLGCTTALEGKAVQTRWGQAAVSQGMNFNKQKLVGCSNAVADNRWVDASMQTVEMTAVQQMSDRAFFKRGERWIDARLVAPVRNVRAQTEIQPDEVVTYGSPRHLEILHKLIAEQRQGMLSLQGEIILQFEGRNILIKNDGC